MLIPRSSLCVALLAVGCALVGAAGAASAQLYYDVDFGTPPHTVGLPPVIGGGPPPRSTVSAIPFGSPTVVASLGALTDQPLEFDSADGQGDQIRFALDDLPPSAEYELRCQLLIEEIAGGNFTVHLDTPTIRNIHFTSGGTVAIFVPGVGSPTIGSYTPGVVVDLRVDVDLANDNWEIYLDGAPAHSGSFGGATAVTAIRVTTPVTAGPPAMIVGLDNVAIAPEIPTTAIAGRGAEASRAPALLAAVEPNPVRGDATRLRYQLPVAAPVRLSIVDVAGRVVWETRRPAMAPGAQVLSWDGVDTGGRRVPAGVYFLRVESGGDGDVAAATVKFAIVR